MKTPRCIDLSQCKKSLSICLSTITVLTLLRWQRISCCRFKVYLLSILSLTCVALKVSAIGPLPLNFEALRSLSHGAAADLFQNWLQQLYTTKPSLLRHVTTQTHVSPGQICFMKSSTDLHECHSKICLVRTAQVVFGSSIPSTTEAMQWKIGCPDADTIF